MENMVNMRVMLLKWDDVRAQKHTCKGGNKCMQWRNVWPLRNR